MDRKQITGLNKDKKALAKRIAHADALLAQIGGQLSDGKARELILVKLNDIAHAELRRRLNGGKRSLVLGTKDVDLLFPSPATNSLPTDKGLLTNPAT